MANNSVNDLFSDLAAAACEAAQWTGDLAADAFNGIRSETERQTEDLKRRMRAAALEREIGEKLQEVGGLIYATHTGDPTDSDVLEAKLKEIDALKEELDGLWGKKKGPRCPACGKEGKPGDKFCRDCGGKL